jgi:hypothetical protein
MSAKIDWLDEMIQSVISQTIADWELILIDDKSPLSLGPVRMKYANDNRLRWLENADNQGPAKTRNTAVALANSDCILPVDSDDMLANNETLEYKYDTWIMDKTKTIYGNVQIYKPTQNGFERSKVHQLAHYSFEGAMNLEFGIMPVTTMHSKEAHYKAGGWKSVLEHGREDLEYWIACGKAGFCGQKINHTTLLYRKHEQSRDYKLKFELNELRAMQDKIKAMHSDIYRGVYPMACCGKGASVAKNNPDPVVLSQQNMNKPVKHITTLDGYNEKDLEWVAYRGPKQGSIGKILIRGASHLPSEYPILGNGHVFQIHKLHKPQFEARQKLGFEINQPDPREQNELEPEPVRLQPEPQVIEVAKPELSTLVRLDRIGGETREMDVVGLVDEVIIEPNAPNSYSDVMVTQLPTDYFIKKEVQASLHISNLGLSDKLTEMLNENGYTVEKITETKIETLTKLPGIGTKRGQAIIEKAQELIKQE